MHNYLLHHLLEQSAKKYPDKVAVVFKEKSVTYADLDGQSSQLALQLMQMGVKKGDRVGILLTKSIEQVVSLFGILKSGAIYVPIDPAAPAGRVDYMIRRCGIECLLTTARQLSTMISGSEGKVAIKTALLFGKDGEEFSHKDITIKCLPQDIETDEGLFESGSMNISDSSPAYILHTSGSTGNPKGVAISHHNALTFIEMAAEFFNARETDRFCCQAPLHFDLSVFDIFVAIRCGATIVLVPELLSTFPVKLAEYIEKEQITIWNSVSSVLTLLADKGGLEQRRLDSLRIVHFSGDLMPVKYLRILMKHISNASFYNVYGQTEANSSLFYPVRLLPDDAAWRIPVGKPFPNFEVFALSDEGGIIARSDEEGELYISGSTVALGYWNDESMTSDKFVPDPRYPLSKKIVYKTGDLVRMDENGDYVFTGRKDHMIKSRGYRVELGEIEAVLLNHPEIAAAVALATPDELIGNRISAIIVPAKTCSITKGDVAGYCAARLPKYMIPDLFEFSDSLPLTSTGKVDRKSLGTMVSELP